MKNIVWHDTCITNEKREQLTQQKAAIVWFTGLSGSGKSTIANLLEEELYKNGNFTYLLDGDNVRHGLNVDLGFDDKSRVENIRRVGEVGKLFVDAGLLVLSAFISPFQKDRELVKKLVGNGEFIEIFIDTPLDICESRDPKGLYKKARSGEIAEFSGITSPYEVPTHPDITIDTQHTSPQEATKIIIEYLAEKNYIKWKSK